MGDDHYLLNIIEDLQQKIEEQDVRIKELESKVDDLYGEYKSKHDPYLNG